MGGAVGTQLGFELGDLEVDGVDMAGTRSRRDSSANTRASIRSVLHANGASPFILRASASSTDQPNSSRGCWWRGCEVYNAVLQEHRDAWKVAGKSIARFDTAGWDEPTSWTVDLEQGVVSIQGSGNTAVSRSARRQLACLAGRGGMAVTLQRHPRQVREVLGGVGSPTCTARVVRPTTRTSTRPRSGSANARAGVVSRETPSRPLSGPQNSGRLAGIPVRLG